ncbi:UNVERIFIED_CONTAM: hypothetical protein FKN15_064590 [Acipenser sinensis]
MASLEAAAENERILREIESTDTNCIGPTLSYNFAHNCLEATREHSGTWYIDLKNDSGSAGSGEPPVKADVVMTLDSADFVKMFTVLEMYNKLQEQMQARRHYPALKTLEQLELIYLPRASQYRFCKIMSENIPKLRSEIKDLSMSDLKDFLESIRKHSEKIGETAMKQIPTSMKFHGNVTSYKE